MSTGEQHLETQLPDLRELAKQRGFEIVGEYTDVISGAKAKRLGLDRLMGDARRRRFDVVLVAAFDRIARNVRHFLEVLDELNHLGIQFVSLRESIDTSDRSQSRLAEILIRQNHLFCAPHCAGQHVGFIAAVAARLPSGAARIADGG